MLVTYKKRSQHHDTNLARPRTHWTLLHTGNSRCSSIASDHWSSVKRALTVNTLTDHGAPSTIQVGQHNKLVSRQLWMYIDPVMMLSVRNANGPRGVYTAGGWYGTRICAWRRNIVPVFLSHSTRILGGLLKTVHRHSCNVIFPLSWYVRPQSQAVKWLDISWTTGAGTCCLHLHHFNIEDGASGLLRNVVT